MLQRDGAGGEGESESLSWPLSQYPSRSWQHLGGAWWATSRDFRGATVAILATSDPHGARLTSRHNLCRGDKMAESLAEQGTRCVPEPRGTYP